MAADGAFFPALARLHPRYRTPGAAIVFQGAWAILLTLTGTYGQLLDYVVFGDWIFFGLVVSTLFVYRRRDRPFVRGPGTGGAAGFRAWGYPVTPALFVLAAVYVVASSVASNPRNAGIGVVLLLLGIPVYLYWKARTARKG
jgi:APA family basic amino acid/polyamine antiporter